MYEGALTAAPHAAVAARRRIVARALAFAADAEALQGRRICATLARHAGGQLDLPDLTPTILAAAPADQRGALALTAAFGAVAGAAVAKEQRQPAAEAEGRRRGLALVHIALAQAAALADDDRVKLSQLCANVGDRTASRQVADAIGDPSTREHAYIMIVAQDRRRCDPTAHRRLSRLAFGRMRFLRRRR